MRRRNGQFPKGFESIERAQREHSNLGSLIMAVLVGLLSLGANEFARTDRRAMDDYLNSWTLFTSAPEQEPVDQAVPAPQTTPLEQELRSLRSQFDEVEEEISTRFSDWQRRRNPRVDEDWMALLRRLDPLIRDLSVTLEEFTQEDREALMRVLFVAAQVEPETFSPAFQDVAQDVIDTGDASVVASAAVLKIFHSIDFAAMDQGEVMRALAEFQVQYPESDNEGVQLCSMVADQLWRTGRVDLAEKVLRYGISRFNGHPGVSRLVNQMIDQQRAK